MSEKKRGETLFSFFNNKTKNEPSDDKVDKVDIDILDDPDPEKQDVIESSAKLKKNDTELNMNAYDIELCVNKELTDEEKFNFCKNTWIPVVGYKFPVIKQGNQNRSFQLDWFRRYHWLAYSELKEGGFCKFCALFAPIGGGRGCQVLKMFVKEPLEP